MARNDREKRVITMRERRRHERIINDFLSWLMIIPKKIINSKALHWDIVSACDLSAGGIRFNYDEEIPAGTPIKLRIIFPVSNKEPIECTGEVVRNELVPRCYNTPIFHIAAVFTSIDREDEMLIDEAANKFHWKNTG